MAMGLKGRASSGGGGFVTFILNATLRFLQFVFAIAVIGLYAQDLNKAHKEDKYTDGKWVRSSSQPRSRASPQADVLRASQSCATAPSHLIFTR